MPTEAATQSAGQASPLDMSTATAGAVSALLGSSPSSGTPDTSEGTPQATGVASTTQAPSAVPQSAIDAVLNLESTNKLDTAPTAKGASGVTTDASSSDKEMNFAKLRGILTQRESEIARLTAELAGNPEQTALLEEYKNKLSANETALQRLDFEKSALFADTYQRPLDDQFTEIKNVMQEFGANPEAANSLLSLSLRDVHGNLTKLVPPGLVPVLMQKFDKLHQLNASRTKALEDHQTSREALEQSHSVEVTQQTQLLRDTTRAEVLDELSTAGHFLVSEVPGNADWNGRVAQYRTAISQAVNSTDVHTQTSLLAKGVLADTYLQLFKEERTRNAQLEAGRTTAANVFPTIGGNPTGAATIVASPQGGGPLRSADYDKLSANALSALMASNLK